MNPPIRHPEADEAERSLVACALLAPATIDDVEGAVTWKDFRNGLYSDLWKVIIGLRCQQKPIDAVAVANELKRTSIATDNAFATVAEIIQSWCLPGNATYYAKSIRERAIKERILRLGMNLVAMGETASVDEMLSVAERDLTAIRDTGVEERLIDSRSLANYAIEELQERRKGLPPGMPFGFREIDRHASMRPGQLWILAARPRIGKSAFALNVATRHAQSRPVLFATMEMRRDELIDRIFADHAGVNHDAIRDGQLFDEQWDRILDASARLSEWNLHIDDTAAQTVTSITSKARKLKRRHDGRGLIVIDYLQLIEPETERGATRNDQLASITRRLKVLAMELDWPILCLSQLNRSADDADKRPTLSMLRDSGAIEQDADNVMFLHRADAYRKPADCDGKATAIILKQRGGREADCDLLWTGEHVRFHDPPLAKAWNPND